MINRFIGRALPVVALVLGSAVPASAFETGVKNEWETFRRASTGTSHLSVKGYRHETGSVETSAFKLDVGKLPAIDGSTKSPGFFVAGSTATGYMEYSDSTKTNFTQNERFQSSENRFGHSVSAFGN